ncbi:MAG: carboxypeptidase-like regulatory domain-containing protein, partial [Bacteroidales bacterium]|nr:carboxypeptidase-like regulatory domain-containing protein [Bacteroidales bacterium]
MKKLLLLFGITIISVESVVAQITVSGRVTDADGEPLPGVSIILKGTQEGTVTDMEGFYIFNDLSKGDILVFSFVGMQSREVIIGTQTQINITLSPDIKNLEEVVIVGYGDVKRANLTGAVVDLRAEELEDIPVGDLSAALDGKLAGVKISSSTGKPGEASVLSIRTESSFGRVTEEVLYVIDGVISDATAFNLLDAS